MCLTETALKNGDIIPIKWRMGYGHAQDNIFNDVSIHPTSNEGVTIVLSKKHELKNIKSYYSGRGQFITLTAKLNTKPITIGTFYGPVKTAYHSMQLKNSAKNTQRCANCAIL